MIDVKEVKNKIISIIQERGPSLPVHIAKQIALQPMFASAIMSELLNEKRIKTSNLKIGSSPLYFIAGQEGLLENFTENLTGVEKEAYLKLKDNKFLEDQVQDPKIRVALRSLKDFAIALQMNGKTYWKYFTLSNEKLKQSLEDEGEFAIGERVVGQKIWEDIRKEKVEEKIKELTAPQLNVIKPEPIAPEIKKVEENIEARAGVSPAGQKIIESKKPKQKKESAFVIQIKDSLSKKSMEILEIYEQTKAQIVAKVRINVDQTCLLIGLDKKRPDEKDLQRAYKKSMQYNLPYVVFTNSEAPKKLKEKIDIYKKLVTFLSLE